jgi:hypothetical protein
MRWLDKAMGIEYASHMLNDVRIIYLLSSFVNSYLYIYVIYSIIYCKGIPNLT